MDTFANVNSRKLLCRRNRVRRCQRDLRIQHVDVRIALRKGRTRVIAARAIRRDA
jgi:hypothetical protein